MSGLWYVFYMNNGDSTSPKGTEWNDVKYNDTTDPKSTFSYKILQNT